MRTSVLERRLALSRALHEPTPMARELAHLRDAATAYRTQAASVAAKLAAFSAASSAAGDVRASVAASSATIDRAVSGMVEVARRQR